MGNKVSIVIDTGSGFCFGVNYAIAKAENELKQSNTLVCLGQIVHNEEEVARLENMGMKTLEADAIDSINPSTLLFRAHGEPPIRYADAEKFGHTIIDGTCPVVLKLQQRIKKAWEASKQNNTQILLFGKKGHAEVVGLLGQTENMAVLIENNMNLDEVDFARPLELFSQTTQSLEEYNRLAGFLREKAPAGVVVHDTICRQVSDRAKKMRLFALEHQLVIFVGGKHSSNGKYLYGVCKESNINTYLVSSVDELDREWLKPGITSIGICGATSTPGWLMENVKIKLEKWINEGENGKN